ncbi:hypothetical protein [Kistimonas asteriae]|uniref:hypothetical protein n=1 Tax=Kistimonas asteriae TaxID=517724 RepID=UPI001BA962AC|nr:hypothetical protein [Kistimonas asteriae]
MTWLIVLLILAVIAGNLMWLMPSKRERQQMVFRQAAMAKKMKVSAFKELEKLPDSCDTEAHWMEYVLPTERSLNIHVPIVLKRMKNHAWVLPDTLNQPVITGLLEELPAGVVQITIRQMSVVALWDERGDKNAIDQLHAVLTSLRDTCL